MTIMEKTKDFLGTGLRTVATILMIGGGFVGLFICIGIVREVFGHTVSYLSLIVFPVLLAVAPWFALFSWGNWFPLIFIYGCALVAGLLFGFANKLKGEEFPS